MAKKDPFPNNWQEIADLNDNEFESLPFIIVLEDSVIWELPDPYCCIIRAYNKETKQLKEYAYKLQTTAHNKIKELANKGHELTILTDAIIGTINY